MSMKAYDPTTDVPAQTGRVFFITGGTAGLGAGFISSLASHSPSHIYFSGRSRQRADALIRRINASNPSMSARLTFIPCDLASLSSVQAAARQVIERTTSLHVLMCNAGIMATPAGLTEDGYETQFGTNHVGHALLIKLLLPLLQRTAASSPSADVRIVNLASVAYENAPKNGIEFASLRTVQDNLGGPIGPKWTRYGQSKLANLLYPVELAKRYPEILSVAVHPGIIMTGLFDNAPLGSKLLLYVKFGGKTTSVEEGYFNQLWAATWKREGLRNGAYYVPVGREGTLTTGAARDGELARRLWEWTEKELEGWEL